MLNEKTILITGGTGSLGRKLVHLILETFRPHRLIVLSRDEQKQFEMAQVWNPRRCTVLQYTLGDVRDRERLMRALDGVDYVIHTAALKHVPTAEINPSEFIKTNVLGTMNVIDAAILNKVKKVVTLSTDKACNPISLYGASKLCADKLSVDANSNAATAGTHFAVVRYGNVLGSRGSVVPFFKERAETGVLPITDIRMTRFCITLTQAAHFVLKCLGMAQGGEIFVPKVPSMKIVDLAQAIGPACRHDVVGIRPGEKVHETLIPQEDARRTLEFKDCYLIKANEPFNSECWEASIGQAHPCPPGFQYASNTNTSWLTIEELQNLVEHMSEDYAVERSRWSTANGPL